MNEPTLPTAQSSVGAAVFLDRDGTLMEEVDYCRDPARVRVLEGVHEGLARLRAAGFTLVIITNQSGIGRGWVKPEEYEAVQSRLLEVLGPESPIAATYFCPDTPDAATDRRKPAPGMLLEAARDLGLELAGSWLIGDKASDVECGRRAGVRPILVQTGYGASEKIGEGVFRADNFSAATEHILSMMPPR